MNGKASYTSTLTLDQRVAALCAELGPDFTYEFGQSIGQPGSIYGIQTFVLKNAKEFAGDAYILLILNEAKNRITASAKWGFDKDNRAIDLFSYVREQDLEPLGSPQDIGFMLTKKAAQQAKDLCARLIPSIAHASVILKAEIDKRAAAVVSATDTAKEIARALGYSEEWIESKCANTTRFPIEISTKAGAPAETRFSVHVDGDIHIKVMKASVSTAKSLIKHLKING